VANVVRTQYLIPKSRDKEYIISIISGAVANVLLNIILIPRMLSIGSAIATVGAEATVCIVQVFYCWKEIKFGQQLMKTIPYFIISLIMGTIVLSFKFEISIIALLTIKIISGVIIFIGLTFTWMKIRGVKI
jgi:O-antigen/teichoic acid export membrane protein